MTEEKSPENKMENEMEEKKLAPSQKAMIERNRQKALLLRQARLMKKPYAKDKNDVGQKVKGPAKVIDTGAGFYLEEDDEEDKLMANIPIKHAPGPIITENKIFCDDCGKEMQESYLKTNYDVDICDVCRENEDKHNLITKTDARTKYLLRDADFDVRDPPLKFISRKNPHHKSWGEMKLFYEPQVYKRAMEIWETEEKIEEERDKREDNKEKTKRKKFDKKVKELRLAVRGSLARKDRGPHQHEYGEETYDEEEDMYSKKCQTCGHIDTYEKM
ncbi:DNA repair protein complementing XP-A cells homolog [Mytilus edulis]|uniref:XPA n=1 Tax=Mytilus edulis TaxID=6550 RepID=A0A8S3VSH6_MYTED|nr:XPA [Mytilus edulis]